MDGVVKPLSRKERGKRENTTRFEILFHMRITWLDNTNHDSRDNKNKLPKVERISDKMCSLEWKNDFGKIRNKNCILRKFHSASLLHYRIPSIRTLHFRNIATEKSPIQNLRARTTSFVVVDLALLFWYIFPVEKYPNDLRFMGCWPLPVRESLK